MELYLALSDITYLSELILDIFAIRVEIKATQSAKNVKDQFAQSKEEKLRQMDT